MSLTEIEAELEHLSTDELRRLAFRSWTVFMQRAGHADLAHDCDEEDPQLLAALDEAIAAAAANPQHKYSATEVRARLNQWTSK